MCASAHTFRSVSRTPCPTQDYNVIHLHTYSWFGLFTILVAKWLRIPIMTKLPNVGEFGLPGLAARRFGGLKLAILLCADALVAMSRRVSLNSSKQTSPRGVY